MKPEGAVRHYQSGMLPFAVDVYIDTYHGPSWVRQQLRGRSGWLQVSKARLSTPISDWTATITTAITDDGRQLGKVSSDAFLAMRSSSPQECFDDPPDELEAMTEMMFWDFLGGCDLRHLDMLGDGEADTAARVALEQVRGERVLGEVDTYITRLRRQRRDPNCTPGELEDLAARIAQFEDKHSAAAQWLVRHLAAIRDEGVQFEADVLDALENHGELEELYSVRWVARSLHDRVVDRAVMVDLTRTASLSGVPLGLRLDAEDRWEIAQAAREKLAPTKVIEPTKRKEKRVEQALRPAQNPPRPGVSNAVERRELSAWRKEERQLLNALAEWQLGKSGVNGDADAIQDRVEPDPGAEALTPLGGEQMDLASAEDVLMQETHVVVTDMKADDSATEIDTIIERELRDLLKDLRPT